MAFTKKFGPAVEKAVAEVLGKPLAAFHLDGAHNAFYALNDEQLPIYCKLHGDSQQDSIRNLSSDLAAQNTELSRCVKMAAARFGLAVAGCSGRDESTMSLFRDILAALSPFPKLK